MPKPAPSGSNWGTADELNAAGREDGAPPAPVAAPSPVKAEEKLPVAAPAPKPEPVAETPKTEDKPAEPTAQQVAAAKKWKIKGKVAGQEQEWEIAEDDFDEKKSPEGHKRLRDALQKAADYDRPGGALDQAAQKRYLQRLHADGYLVVVGVGKDAHFEWSPEYVAWQNRNKNPVQATPAAVAAAATSAAPQSANAKRIGELQEKAERSGLGSKELSELSRLEAAEEFDARERVRDERTASEQKKAQEAERQNLATQDAEAQGRARIRNFVAQFKDKYKDPLTGQVDPQEIAEVEGLMERKAIEFQDWAQAEAAVRTHAERTAKRNEAIVSKLTTAKPTAPPPAPVLRGGQTASAGANGDGKDKGNGKFDPRKGFGQQPNAFDEYVRSEAGRE